LEVVVTGGPDVGTRRPLTQKLLIGRGRAAALQLSDLGVSRRHLEVEPTAGGVHVKTVGSASPFAARGSLSTEAVIPLGERIVIGETALTFVVGEIERQQSDGEVTKIHALLDDAAVDARGLAAIFELGEVLNQVREEGELESAINRWAGRALRITARLERAAGGTQPQQDEVLQRDVGPNRELVIPLVSESAGAVIFTIAQAGADVGQELQRLLAVAARMVSATLLQLRRLTTARDATRELRQLAVGSATTFLGSTPAAEHVAKLLPRLAASDVTALLIGETGAGKSFVARVIHELSPRSDEPFRVINCAAIPADLVESELFGHERGAFTGAHQARLGAFEAAAGGTLLLDEVGDLPLTSQPKLLSVLEDKRFERVGSNKSIPLRARVLVATNRDLEGMIAAGTFRSDLFYRISAVTLPLPSLRERAADIPALGQGFLQDMSPSLGRRVDGWSDEALAALMAYPWPGNVRELRNVLEHAVVLGDGPRIELSDLPPRVAKLGQAVQHNTSAEGADVVQLPMSLADLETRAIAAALRACGNNRTQAAAVLGINRATLYKKLKSSS
jgi:DNA-binding NtrC family response regulator